MGGPEVAEVDGSSQHHHRHWKGKQMSLSPHHLQELLPDGEGLLVDMYKAWPSLLLLATEEGSLHGCRHRWVQRGGQPVLRRSE